MLPLFDMFYSHVTGSIGMPNSVSFVSVSSKVNTALQHAVQLVRLTIHVTS